MLENILVYPITLSSRSEVIKIKPIMDLHKGAKNCDLRAFKEYIKDIDERTYFFTNGDLWDMIFFNDKRFRISGHDSKGDIDDDPIDEEISEMADILSPLAKNMIAIGTGNHEDQISKTCHTNPSKRLAEKINVPYMGYSYWLRLKPEQSGRVRTIDFFISHGFGGGTRTEGGSITKYSKFADRFLCDVFVVGHDHRKQYVRYPTLGIKGDKHVRLYAQSKLVVLGGSWKKTYGSGTSVTWEESKGFPSSEIGGVTIEIKVSDPGIKLSVSM